MKTLDSIYGKCPEYLEWLKERLVIPGWAGELEPYEVRYIKEQLRASKSLRRLWGVKNKNVPLKKIKTIAGE